MTKTDHLYCSDGQVKPGQSIEHWTALGNLCAKERPSRIIFGGDHADMPSLSSWDRGKRSHQNRYYQDDIQASDAAMNAFMKPIYKVKSYNPKLIMTLGNHEDRIDRYINSNSELSGKLSTDDLNFKAHGWKVYKFGEYVNVDGIWYSHYFSARGTGRALGGTANNMLNKLGFSFTQGHRQGLDIGRKDLNNGITLQGLICGSYYLHDKDYMGPQGNNHFRGCVLKSNVCKGTYDLETLSIQRIMELFL